MQEWYAKRSRFTTARLGDTNEIPPLQSNGYSLPLDGTGLLIPKGVFDGIHDVRMDGFHPQGCFTERPQRGGSLPALDGYVIILSKDSPISGCHFIQRFGRDGMDGRNVVGTEGIVSIAATKGGTAVRYRIGSGRSTTTIIDAFAISIAVCTTTTAVTITIVQPVQALQVDIGGGGILVGIPLEFERRLLLLLPLASLGF
mmetsp:Transcript_1926/g.4476  ORF Transcript_1926/g.4476 Transcript_1926/m.4476 type:complete len:200 (-) Transcript_1926:465-1064(-)